jgi:hypothetical protein
MYRGCCSYFGGAIVVAFVSYVVWFVAWHIGHAGPLYPTWYWKAKLPENVKLLDSGDTAALKKVLFGGEPWLLQCYSGIPHPGQHLPGPYRLHPVFRESAATLKSIVSVGVLDCEKILPSNKSLIGKFGFVRRTQPLVIYAGGGDKPKQVPSASVASAYGVTAWVKPKAEPTVRVVRSQKALDAYCAGRRACLIARMSSDSSVLLQLARAHRQIEVVAVGDEAKASLAWGRGEEVGETLEEEEAEHFGKRVSLLRPDPAAPRARKGAKDQPPRLLQGFTGEEDFPSLSRFVERGLLHVRRAL